jgi:predicted RNase H-like nuclease
LTVDTPSRRGPNLPYSLVAGVTPCGPGWLVAAAKLHGTTFAPEEPRVLESFVEVLDQRPSFSTVAVNAPIGYVNQDSPEGRACDREARALLGRRGSAVRSAPRRDPSGYDALSPEHLDAVTRNLLGRYREISEEMAPYRQRSVYEVNSELSFYQLNGDVPLRWPKNSEAGGEERRELLAKRIPGVDRILSADIKRVRYSHLLDAAAFLWTARRIFAKAALRVPTDPQWDDEGMRMEIVR